MGFLMVSFNPSDFDRQAFAERLKQIMGSESRKSFARRAGMSDTSIRKYENLEALPNVERLIGIAVAGNVDIRWLICGDKWQSILVPHQGEPFEWPSGTDKECRTDEMRWPNGTDIDVSSSSLMRKENSSQLALNDSDFTKIDSYQVFASAGHGQHVNDEQRSEPMAFRTEWLRKEGLKPDRLAVIRAKGDSMEPTISDNDIILLHMANGDAPRDGLHVIRMEGGLFVKRLQFSPLGDVKVVSDNPTYQSWHFTKEQRADLHVVGRVVWAGKKF